MDRKKESAWKRIMQAALRLMRFRFRAQATEMGIHSEAVIQEALHERSRAEKNGDGDEEEGPRREEHGMKP
jgi:hypothetical protein